MNRGGLIECERWFINVKCICGWGCVRAYVCINIYRRLNINTVYFFLKLY